MTFPPGVVFYLGVWIHQEEQIIPIRFINFEQNCIVIDVAGPTEAIDGIADRLFGFYLVYRLLMDRLLLVNQKGYLITLKLQRNIHFLWMRYLYNHCASCSAIRRVPTVKDWSLFPHWLHKQSLKNR